MIALGFGVVQQTGNGGRLHVLWQVLEGIIIVVGIVAWAVSVIMLICPPDKLKK